MEILALILVVVMPIAFLIWTLRLKGVLALLTAAPVLFLNIIVISLNVGVTKAEPPALDYTHKVIANTTAIVSGNQTVTSYAYTTVTDTIPVGFQNLMIINIMMLIFTFVMVFVIIDRVTADRRANRRS